ncbi:MAG: PAS domain-containing protein [Pseudomonadota bacterium]
MQRAGSSPSEDAIAESMMPGRTDAVRQIFEAQGARPPLVSWSPRQALLHHPLLERFADQCRAVAADDARLWLDRLDLEAFAALRDWMMVVDVVEDGRDFIYAHYGRAIAEHYGHDMTGAATSAFGGHISAFFTGLYRAALVRQEWVLSEHEPPRSVFVRCWRRLIVPVFVPGPKVARFVALNIAENELKAGLDMLPDPVFVLDRALQVMYANGAAREIFRPRTSAPGVLSFEELTGQTLDPDASPIELLGGRQVRDRIEINLGDKITEPVMVTINGVLYRDQALYAVSLRLLSPDLPAD